MIKKVMFVSVIIVSMVMLNFGQGRHKVHTFDVTTPVTIDGKIVKVETVKGGNGRYANGVHLTVNDGGKESLVVVGPAPFLDAKGIALAEGENVSIKTFKGTGNDSGRLFAAEITHAGKQLVLRESTGRPTWRQSMNRKGSGWRNGRGRGNR